MSGYHMHVMASLHYQNLPFLQLTFFQRTWFCRVKLFHRTQINIWSDKWGQCFIFSQRPWLDEHCSTDKVTFGKPRENFGPYNVKFCSTARTFVGRGVIAWQYFVGLSSWLNELRATWPVINLTDNFLLDDTNSLTQAGEMQVWIINPSIFLLFSVDLVGYFTFAGELQV